MVPTPHEVAPPPKVGPQACILVKLAGANFTGRGRYVKQQKLHFSGSSQAAGPLPAAVLRMAVVADSLAVLRAALEGPTVAPDLVTHALSPANALPLSPTCLVAPHSQQAMQDTLLSNVSLLAEHGGHDQATPYTAGHLRK